MSLILPLLEIAALLAIAAACVFLLRTFTRQPRNDRNWRDHLARLAHIDLRGDGFGVDPVRDWSFSPAGPLEKTYTSFSAQFADLRDVWFVVEPSIESPLASHTLLMFEFAGSRLICMTIEARLTQGQKWTAFRGLWNQYELFYLWASARDTLVSRVVFLKHDIEVFATRLTEAQKRGLLLNVLKTTVDLETRPRFYNTLFSNCTNELGKRANLSWTPAFVFTGIATQFLFRKGIIPGATIKDAMERASFTGRVKALAPLDSKAFDNALLGAIRTAWNGVKPSRAPAL